MNCSIAKTTFSTTWLQAGIIEVTFLKYWPSPKNAKWRSFYALGTYLGPFPRPTRSTGHRLWWRVVILPYPHHFLIYPIQHEPLRKIGFVSSKNTGVWGKGGGRGWDLFCHALLRLSWRQTFETSLFYSIFVVCGVTWEQAGSRVHHPHPSMIKITAYLHGEDHRCQVLVFNFHQGCRFLGSQVGVCHDASNYLTDTGYLWQSEQL